ncbi:UNVERIFIED_CONTAM: hypothetical protein GTU68_048193 [Idotea baltica]|nr:hypothetical protein [Idotea baltica]
MRSFLLYDKNDVRFCEIPYPEAAKNEVVVQVKSVGICGSDVHYYKDGKIGDFIPKEPFALGHELSGIINKESPMFPNLTKGTRVSINPSRPCRNCSTCNEGLFNLCPSMKYIGSASVYPHLNGGFSEFIKIPGENCVKLADFISFEMAALLEPLSVVLHAIGKAGQLKGKSVLITGAGTIGQLCHMVAALQSPSKVVITDIRNSALDVAKKFQVTAALSPTEQNFDKTLNNIAPSGFDILLEASGASNILKENVKFLRKGGTVIQLGMFSEKAQFPFADFMKNELNFQTSFRFNNEYDLAVNLLEKRALDLTRIITSRFSYDKIPEAIKHAASSTEEIKVVVEN